MNHSALKEIVPVEDKVKDFVGIENYRNKYARKLVSLPKLLAKLYDK